MHAPARRSLAPGLAALAICALVGCQDFRERTIGDDSPKVVQVDAGNIQDVIREAIRECRQALADAGRLQGSGTSPAIDACSVTPLYDGCPLRVCVVRLVERVAPQCPPRDSGAETPGSAFCDAVVWPFLPDQP